ncbi:MAG: type II secretion system GspH family protein [Puniceicoccales bacterium]|jgi:prepilin-type N-terminal cleavage/methylation domain-containing protein|nr:type II secretion system GspH family protein [Puniceicoccales bacterium]
MNILNKQNRGFTLIEVLIVLAILAGIAVTLTRSVGSGRDAALAQQTRIDMDGRIRTAIVAKVSSSRVIPQSGVIEATYLNLNTTNDPYREPYEFTVSGNIVTVSPKSGGKAATAGVTPITIDLSPYLPF